MSDTTPKKQRYQHMTLGELREATRQYDAEDIDPKPAPVSAKEKARNTRVVKALRAASRRSSPCDKQLMRQERLKE